MVETASQEGKHRRVKQRAERFHAPTSGVNGHALNCQTTDGWFKMPNALIDAHGARIGAVAIAVLAYLLRRRNQKDRPGESWPGLARLQADLSLSRHSVLHAIRTLEDAKIVRVERDKGKGNVYRVNDQSA